MDKERIIKKNNLHYFLDLIRIRDRDGKETSNILYNILHVMNVSRNNCIDAEDFHEIDFKDIALHKYNFSGDGCRPSTFDGAKLYFENFGSIIPIAIDHIETSIENDLMILSNKDGLIQIWKLSKKVLRGQIEIKNLLTWKYFEQRNYIVILEKDGLVSRYSMTDGTIRVNKLKTLNLKAAVFYDLDTICFIDDKDICMVNWQELFIGNDKKEIITKNVCFTNVKKMFVNNKNIFVTACKWIYVVQLSERLIHKIELEIDAKYYININGFTIVASDKEIYIYNNELVPETILSNFSQKIIGLNQVYNNLAVCLANGDVELYNLELKHNKRWKAHNLDVIYIHENDKYCITSSLDNTLCFWKHNKNDTFIKLSTLQSYIASFVETNRTDSCFITASQFHSTLEVWDMDQNQKIGYLDTVSDGISAIKVFNETAIVSTFSGSLLSWCWNKNEYTKKEFGNSIIKMDAIADGAAICLLISKEEQKIIKWYDTDYEVMLEFVPITKSPTTVKFLSRTRLAVAGLEGMIEVYGLNGELLHNGYPYGYPNSIYDLHLSPDKSMLGVQFYNAISFFSALNVRTMIPCSDYISSHYICVAAQYKRSNLVAVYDGNHEIKILTIHGAQTRHILPCSKDIVSFSTSGNKKTLLAGSNDSEIYKYTNFKKAPQKLYYLPELKIIGCTFFGVKCENEIKELLRQQGALL